MINIKSIILFIIILQTGCIAYCQTPDEVKAQFPGNEIVWLNYNHELKLKIKDGNVIGESTHEKELLVLSEKNASLYSRSEIYHSSYNELKDINAYTKVPDGNKYKKIKTVEQKTSGISSTSIFEDDSKVTGFNYPGMITNAIQYLQYKMFAKDAHLITPFYLPSSVPVMSAVYTVIVPNDINIRYRVKNDPNKQFTFTEEKRNKEIVYRWTSKNYKAPENFENAPDDSYYAPHVIIHVTDFISENTTHSYLNNLDDLFKWNASHTNHLNITVDPELKKITDSLISGKTTDTEKAKSIYKWVQQNIKYIAFESGVEGFQPRQASDVCRKRYGDCKDMSSIITQMLRIASVKAFYTWIGTRDIPYKYSDIPLPLVDNHMITAAFIQNKWIFLDGTNPHSSFGLPPAFIQNKEALIALSDTEYKIITVPESPAEESGIVDSTFISFTETGIKGTEKVNYFGYSGEDNYNILLSKNDIEKRDLVKTRMGKGSNKFILGDYKITEVNPDENIINITADFEIPGYGKKIGNAYYINLNLEKLFENRVIDTGKRKIPIEEKYRYSFKQYHILQIPAGYSVSYKPRDFNFENNLVSLRIKYDIKDGKIIAYQEVKNKSLLIYPADFPAWNDAARSVALQYKEQVVLEKNN